jgi:crotonobetainyl-CoA:carnitine CoA-transferase CaiB-like acyl-CoA transferase
MTHAQIPAHTLPLASPREPNDLLHGVRIVDLTTSIAGPYATQLLADLGADVIKIERPETGDDSRQWGPPFLDGISLWYLTVNRNKRSLTLDYSCERGYEVLRALVRASDVVVTNYVPRVQLKLGIDHASLAQLRPDLVHVSITGYGFGGGEADQPCYDIIAEGLSGVMDMTGEPDSRPQKVGTAAADLLAGSDAALACLAALFERRHSGRGKRIDVCLFESMTRFMAPVLMSHLGSGEPFSRSGGRASVIAVYQMFETADEPLTLALPNEGIWRRFCETVGLGELLQDPDYRDNAKRHRQRAPLVRRIQDLLRTQPRDHWLALFARERIPSGPINRVDQVAQDPRLRARGFLFAIPGAQAPLPQVGLGIQFDGQPRGYRRAPPAMGEHNAEILEGLLGMSRDECERLRLAGTL